jgi:putative transposase
MKKSKFTEEQIAWALKQADLGTPVEVCRALGIAKATFFNWKKKYAGMSTYELRRLRDLETENQKLKQLVADLSLDQGYRLYMLEGLLLLAKRPQHHLTCKRGNNFCELDFSRKDKPTDTRTLNLLTAAFATNVSTFTGS